jgi:hypothetical protein
VFFGQEDILMRSIVWTFFLTPVLCTTAAFATDKVSVDMPFSFTSHGKVFPASQYDVSLTGDRRMLTLSSRTNPGDTISWVAFVADRSPTDPELSVKFDRVGNMPELHAVRLGTYTTPILDERSVTLKNRVRAQSGQ